MGSTCPGSPFVQAFVTILALFVFTGILVLIGCTGTSNIPEHQIRPDNASTTPLAGSGLVATATSAPSFRDDIPATLTPVPDGDNVDSDNVLLQADTYIQQLPVTLLGNGSQVTQSFWLVPGTVSFSLAHGGQENFTVWLMCDDDQQFECLAAQGGDTKDLVNINVPTAGAYFLNITTDGEWIINISEQDELLI